MKTPKPRSLAARKSRSRFSTVLLSRTLAPTRAQETPVSLRTSFCGSMTTRAVSLALNSTVMLLVGVPRFARRRPAPRTSARPPGGLLRTHVLAEELPHQPGDGVALGLQGEMAGVEQVVLQRLQVPFVRLGPGGREDLVILAPRDQHRRLVRAEV